MQFADTGMIDFLVFVCPAGIRGKDSDQIIGIKITAELGLQAYTKLLARVC